MPRPLIVANWKMNGTVADAQQLVAAMNPGLAGIKGVGKVLCPPFTALAAVSEMLQDTDIALGAQDMYHEDSGAFTGQISPGMLAEFCSYIILGHSERRSLFGETSQSVAKKVAAAKAAGLRPIMCVGETISERETGRAEAVVDGQVLTGLAGVNNIDGVSIAYEPVWAIGSGAAASPKDAQSMASRIRQVLSNRFGQPATKTPILYGGSVTEENIPDFMGQPDIDGALVGGASLKPDVFVALTRAAAASV
ncbi:MAG: triose-phosphate isomerase [SAR202 cluster bacterium]|nr:triose-phosphate isomerase [SAR202 cluster bacterium]